MFANALSIVALGLAWLWWQPYVVVLGCLLAMLVFPSVAALVAAAARRPAARIPDQLSSGALALPLTQSPACHACAQVPPERLGAAQGLISGARSLADGLSPLVYGPLFGAFRATPLPGGPFVLAAGLVAIAGAALSVPTVKAALHAPRSTCVR
jgi:hypothetical protein